MGSGKGRWAEKFRDKDRGKEGHRRKWRGGDKMEPIGEEEEPEPHSPGRPSVRDF